MDIKIAPEKLTGSVCAISSKSDAHRIMIAAALSDKKTQIKLNCVSEDVTATAACIKALGGNAERNEDGFLVTPIDIEKVRAPSLDFGESGSTARFLIPVAAALFEKAEFSGHGRLPDRPFSPLFDTMRKNGCKINSDRLPAIHDGKLKSGIYEIDGNISSQFISGLLFALPIIDSDSEIRLKTPLQSSGYVDMTIETLSRFGIKIDKIKEGYHITGGQKYISPGKIIVEGDWSNAAFWLAAGALGKNITVTGLDINSLQGDKAIENLLLRFGAEVIRENNGLTVKPGSLRGIEIDAGEIPDLVPVLAMMGTAAEGVTLIKNASRLRLKESDRLASISYMMSSLGSDIKTTDDGLIIYGGHKLRGGTVDSCGDHRIAMAAAITSILCETDIKIRNAETVNKSYPSFFDDFKKLGGKVNVI